MENSTPNTKIDTESVCPSFDGIPYECPIDSFIPYDRAQMCTKCSQVFCFDCISSWLKRDKACPNCKYEVKFELATKFGYKPIVEHIPIKCKFSKYGCSEYVSLKDASEHNKICQFGLIECLFCFMKVTRNNLITHAKTECLAVTVVCSICRLNVLIFEVKDHIRGHCFKVQSTANDIESVSVGVLLTDPVNDLLSLYESTVSKIRKCSEVMRKYEMRQNMPKAKLLEKKLNLVQEISQIEDYLNNVDLSLALIVTVEESRIFTEVPKYIAELNKPQTKKIDSKPIKVELIEKERKVSLKQEVKPLWMLGKCSACLTSQPLTNYCFNVDCNNKFCTSCHNSRTVLETSKNCKTFYCNGCFVHNMCVKATAFCKKCLTRQCAFCIKEYHKH